ncbi:DUF2911 domain-containing protein [Lacihabitans sp. LS3-19]|uniref:DUF2911 domain-containing protein n=1 Tax=Lacihabitans sp. LS3-19 TaxID=2487335 RepID=UPI0020CED48D|nr:DUF2911 domain-containing protein [Lacihabitans sp. LS3-19]MCP9768549.1 DUF2911 domain-containing protein [Lacihabitans sp. LS3-19]
MRKNISYIILLLTITITTQAQQFRGLDKSVMDMSYYPDNYAHDRTYAPEKIGGEKARVRITYTRPAKIDREIFGKLVPYDKLWRLGANEASEIKFYQNVTIMGQKVKAGSYTLFAIPSENEWTIILNKELDVWGDAEYKEKDNVLSVKVKTKPTEEMVENFSIQFSKSATKGADMNIAWDKTMVSVPIEF